MNFYLKENLRAAKIFLNTLGFTLEEVEDIDSYQISDIQEPIVLRTLKIYNQENEVVGALGFCNNSINIKVRVYKDIYLKAEYVLDRPLTLKGYDNEEITNFNNSISYKIFDGLHRSIIGTFNVYSFENQNNERYVGVEQNLKRFREGIEEFEASLGLDKVLKLDFGNQEAVNINLRDEFGQTKAPVVPDYRTVVSVDTENGKPYIARIPLRSSTKSSKESEKVLDTYYYVDLLRRKLTLKDIPMFENLASISLNELDDEEFSKFLGFDRETINFQNGSSDITSAYFETDSITK